MTDKNSVQADDSGTTSSDPGSTSTSDPSPTVTSPTPSPDPTPDPAPAPAPTSDSGTIFPGPGSLGWDRAEQVSQESTYQTLHGQGVYADDSSGPSSGGDSNTPTSDTNTPPSSGGESTTPQTPSDGSGSVFPGVGSINQGDQVEEAFSSRSEPSASIEELLGSVPVIGSQTNDRSTASEQDEYAFLNNHPTEVEDIFTNIPVIGSEVERHNHNQGDDNTFEELLTNIPTIEGSPEAESPIIDPHDHGTSTEEPLTEVHTETITHDVPEHDHDHETPIDPSHDTWVDRLDDDDHSHFYDHGM